MNDVKNTATHTIIGLTGITLDPTDELLTHSTGDKYRESLKEVYDDKKTYKVNCAIMEKDGEVFCRLHVERNEKEVGKPLEVSPADLDNGWNVLMNRIPGFELGNTLEVVEEIKEALSSMQPIPIFPRYGLNLDRRGAITGYSGAVSFDDRGEPVTKDPYSDTTLPCACQHEDLTKLQAFIKGHSIRQLAILASLSAVVCAVLRKNILFALVGDSSTGKTSILRLATGLFGNPYNMPLALNWNSTPLALIARLGDAWGVPVLIDDTQLAKYKQFEVIIYMLAEGRSRDRLEKQNKQNKPAETKEWYTTIGITGEQSLLATCSNKGVLGRLLEVPVQGDDLFDNAEQASEMQEYIKTNHGFAALRTCLHKGARRESKVAK